MTTKKTTKTETRQNHPVDDVFEFNSGDVLIRLPYVENIPMGILEDAPGDGRTVASAIDFIVAELTKDQEDERRALPLSEYGRLISDWDDASGISLGELFG